MWRLVFEPLTGNFELRKMVAGGGGGGAGGTVTGGTLQFPGGVSFEIIDGIATVAGGEFLLENGSTILVLAE